MVWRTGRVKLPLDTFLNKRVSEYLLIPVVDVVEEFLFSSDEVCSVVGPDDGWDAAPGDKPFDSHHTATGVH